MAAKSGAGASVSSGAGFQAHVGAYLVVCGICALETDFVNGAALRAISFETTEPIDDINVETVNGQYMYFQAKATIDYSVAENSELRAVFEQFTRQYEENKDVIDKLALVTTGRSSRKVIYDLRAGLDAFRDGDEGRFRKDQPKALVGIVDELLKMVGELREKAGQRADCDVEKAVLRHAFVFIVDLENADALGQSVLLILQSRHFAAPAAFWGKIVSDCIAHAKARHTVTIEQARADYERFRVVKGELPRDPSDDLIRVEFGDRDFPVGREVVLGRLSSGVRDLRAGLAIFEFYRFDNDCIERIRFSEGKCILQNGLEIELIRRTATFDGLSRLIAADPSLIGEEQVAIAGINSDEDFEVGLCAETHRARLRSAALNNKRPLQCIHCGSPVSELSAPMIEVTHGTNLIVGLSHLRCLEPEDRVIGRVQSKFFEEYSALINFDVNGWFRAAHGGQIAFANADYLHAEKFVMLWGGRRASVNAGQFVVEMQLQGGGSEIVTIRNGVQRFLKTEAGAFADDLNSWIGKQESTDALCYSDQTKAFGPRTLLLKQIGGREKIVPVARAQVRRYDQRFAARYSRPGSWYAPLMFVRSFETELPLRILGAAVLLTNPLEFANYLANWKGAGVPVHSYETASLLTDAVVDDFMAEMEEMGCPVIIDPLLVSDSSTRFVAGVPFRSVERTTADAGNYGA